MAQFAYQGRMHNGRQCAGELEAGSAQSVADNLNNLGIVPVAIKKVEKNNSWFSQLRVALFSQRRVTRNDLIMFCHQMQSITAAGLPLPKALRHLAQLVSNLKLKNAILEMVNSLNHGNSLAQAMSEHPHVFPGLMISTVKVGESTGKLPEIFLHLADYLNLSETTIKKVTGLLRYPIFLLLLMVVVLYVINVFLVPAFADVYKRFNAELPWATLGVIAFSTFMIKHWMMLVAGLVSVSILSYIFVHSKKGKLIWDHSKLSFPIYGKMQRQLELTRFVRAFSFLVENDVPLLDSIQQASDTLKNAWLKQAAENMADAIHDGATLTVASQKSGIFPELVIQMIAIGEETNEVGSLLQEIAKHYERELEYNLQRLEEITRPLLLGAMAVMVFFLAAAVYLPMWSLYEAASRGIQ